MAQYFGNDTDEYYSSDDFILNLAILEQKAFDLDHNCGEKGHQIIDDRKGKRFDEEARVKFDELKYIQYTCVALRKKINALLKYKKLFNEPANYVKIVRNYKKDIEEIIALLEL